MRASQTIAIPLDKRTAQDWLIAARPLTSAPVLNAIETLCRRWRLPEHYIAAVIDMTHGRAPDDRIERALLAHAGVDSRGALISLVLFHALTQQL